MHNSYYFLNSLAAALNVRLQGFTLVSCFSQSKDELLLEFNNAKHSVFLKASLLPDLQCLSFPAQLNRARKNSVDLFNELVMKKFVNALAIANDRSLVIHLDGDSGLLFKMHGKQSNVICLSNDRATDIFRKNHEQDMQLTPASLAREQDWSEKGYLEAADHTRHYFTFGKEVWEYLNENGYQAKGNTEQWKMIDSLRDQLIHPAKFYHIENTSGLVFSLLPFGNVVEEFRDPLEAVTAFVSAYTSRQAFNRERASQLSRLNDAIKKTKQYLSKTEEHLLDITNEKHFQAWGDLLMANLHKVQPGASSVLVENLYDGNRQIEIKINPQISPQKNAEVYYRKAKNRALEVTRLRQQLQEKSAALSGLDTQKALIENATSLKELRSLSTPSREHKSSVAVRLPYRELAFKGYRILVGKDASSNDELTFRFGVKDDLWLHAKDVSGSHVLIKHQSGKKFPKDVIERAAELAAFFSKRKGESLCPVAMTERKFVRKRKGDPAGAVVVEKEKVLMVEPKGL